MYLMRTLLLLAGAAAAGFAQNAPAVIGNDQVRGLRVNQAPHNKTRLHNPQVNRVMIYVQPGKQTFEWEGGKKTVLTWKAGEAKWSPAGGNHIAEITSDA